MKSENMFILSNMSNMPENREVQENWNDWEDREKWEDWEDRENRRNWEDHTTLATLALTKHAQPGQTLRSQSQLNSFIQLLELREDQSHDDGREGGFEKIISKQILVNKIGTWQLTGGSWQVAFGWWQVEGGRWPNCMWAVSKAGIRCPNQLVVGGKFMT